MSGYDMLLDGELSLFQQNLCIQIFVLKPEQGLTGSNEKLNLFCNILSYVSCSSLVHP